MPLRSAPTNTIPLPGARLFKDDLARLCRDIEDLRKTEASENWDDDRDGWRAADVHYPYGERLQDVDDVALSNVTKLTFPHQGHVYFHYDGEKRRLWLATRRPASWQMISLCRSIETPKPSLFRRIGYVFSSHRFDPFNAVLVPRTREEEHEYRKETGARVWARLKPAFPVLVGLATIAALVVAILQLKSG